MDDDLPYIPGHLLVKLPRLSDRGAVEFLEFIRDLASDIESHYYGQIQRFYSNAIGGPDDLVQPDTSCPESDPPS